MIRKIVIIPRYLEYIIILIYFNRNNPNLNLIFLILKLYLLLNFIFVILQQIGFVGEFSSLGYESPNELTDDRPTGLTGGPWELSNCSAVIFFTIIDKNQSNLSKYFFSIISIYLILATQSRTILVSFIIAYSFYFYIQNVDKRKFYLFILLLFSTFSLLVISLQFKNFFLSNIKEYLELITLFKNLIFNLATPDLDELDGKLWSMAIRIEHWLIFISSF